MRGCANGLAIFILLVVSLLAGTAVAQTVTPELEQAIRGAAPGEKFSVIVSFSERPDLSTLSTVTARARRTALVQSLRAHGTRQQAFVNGVLQGYGATSIRSLWIANSVAITVNAWAIAALAKMPEVASIGVDRPLSAPITSLAATAVPEWNIAMVNAPALWNLGISGQGVVVASIDTGVDAGHPALAAKWRGGANSWYDPYGEHATPYDSSGHGTQTMGLMVGGDSGGTAVGIAPGATWIAAKGFNDAGNALTSQIHLAFQWLLDPDDNPATDDAPDVVNNSWGYGAVDNCVLEFQPDIEMLKLAGIAVVFSAGNDGPKSSSDVSPANNPSSFAAGAVDQNMQITGFSSRGPSRCDATLFPEVVAPGDNIVTTDLSFGGFDLYATVSGTSFSAPHVSGGIALLKSAFPNASVAEIETALRVSAVDLGVAGADNNYGAGLIDLAAAYQSLQTPVSIDQDGDGYVAGVDCNDSDATVYPNAPEIKHDGVDQDCNGYDLTIDILTATYDARYARLKVEATSVLGGSAGLQLANYGAMHWNAKRGKWSITVSGIASVPASVEVTGVEGSEFAAVSSSGGIRWKKR